MSPPAQSRILGLRLHFEPGLECPNESQICNAWARSTGLLLAHKGMNESEWQTRKQRVDTRLRSVATGKDWTGPLSPATPLKNFPQQTAPRIPVFVNGRFLGISEAKKVFGGLHQLVEELNAAVAA